MKRQALGRGLSALLSEDYQEARELVAELDLDSVEPAARQPRTSFAEAALEELARSIESNGILQPIIVRRDGARLEIVAGERRWRAARQAGLKKIPAIIRDLPPQRSLEVALVENLQREDLNALEQARAYEWLIADYGLSQEEVAARVGKDRTTVTNMLRLLKLPAEVQELVRDGRLAMGHARALLAISGAERQRTVAQRIVAEGLSVRQVEELARGPAAVPGTRERPAEKAPKDVHDRSAERRLQQRLGTRVAIRRSRKGGRIEVLFYSEEELQRLFELLIGEE